MLGPFAIEQIFDDIWSRWPNREGESSAKKAVSVYFKSGESKENLLRAVEGYILETINSDPAYTYKLSNFINQDHWRDVLENTSIDKLKKKHIIAEEIISLWNKSCRPHWCKVVDVSARIGMVMSALNNDAFNTHWMDALHKAKEIFRHQFQESDPRQKIILSLSWFVSISPKHTVLRIIEGEYGNPEPEQESKHSEKKIILSSNEERAAAAEEFKKLLNESHIKLRYDSHIQIKDHANKTTTTKPVISSNVEKGIGDDTFEIF